MKKMKNNIFLFYLLLCVSSGAIAIHNDGEDGPPCGTYMQCENPESNCQCYCSLCGSFRNKNATDSPVYYQGKCFCRQKRDVVHCDTD